MNDEAPDDVVAAGSEVTPSQGSPAGLGDGAEVGPDEGASPEAGEPVEVTPAAPESVELEDLSEPLMATPVLEPRGVGTVLGLGDAGEVRLGASRAMPLGLNRYEADLVGEAERPVTVLEAGDETGRALLRRQDRLVAELDSPLFPERWGLVEEEERTYWVTSPIPEESSLEELFAESPLPLDRILRILTQVAFALQKLHEKGFAHLALRPQAVILSQPVTIADLTRSTPLGEVAGSPFSYPGYTAPEAGQGQPVDARSDVYSVGAMLYRAVRGQPVPEVGVSLMAEEWPALPAGVPQLLHHTLGAPESRYPSAGMLHAALKALVQRRQPRPAVQLAAVSTIGLNPSREKNQDAYGYLTGQVETDTGAECWAWFALADGMGGMSAGEEASAAALEALLAAATGAGLDWTRDAGRQAAWLKEAVVQANDRVCDRLEQRQARGGTTVVAGSLAGRRLAMAYVGDSRAYLLGGGEARLLTRDHSTSMLRAMQGEIRIEEIRTDENRSALTRSLGDRRPLPDYYVDGLEVMASLTTIELAPGDVILLASDGLWEPVVEAEMVAAVADSSGDLRAAAQRLVELALERGAADNATVLLVRVDEVPSGG